VKFFEANFDGLIGPTHNYSGLAKGNLASARNANKVSRPKEAALQGLKKMETLARLGYKQGFLLPQLRPDLSALYRLGFTGSEQNVLNQASKQAPELLAMIYSASSMWAANAATVTPSLDSCDGRVHFTPANLVTSSHRAIEHVQTQRCLETIFENSDYFCVHPALPSTPRFADEGAANHTRLSSAYSDSGVGLFVYGRDHNTDLKVLDYPARQTLEASEAIARQYKHRSHTLFLKQSAEAINAGAFHNDVVCVGNGPVLFFHEKAFDTESQAHAFGQLNELLPFKPICVPDAKVSLKDAISSYLFNSQLLADPSGNLEHMTLIAPTECEENQAVRSYLASLIEAGDTPIKTVRYVDVRQSMSNGGGPACLRLRVLLSEEEITKVNPNFWVNDDTLKLLRTWVKKHYRDQLSPDDLQDVDLCAESHNAIKELAELLGISDSYLESLDVKASVLDWL